MAQKDNRHEKSIQGVWYTTHPDDSSGEGCIACNVCYTGAPEFFAEDEDGFAYVKKQPTNPDEENLCQEQLDACPVGSIGRDG